MKDIRLSEQTIEAILNCLDSAAADRTEPERYREWFADSAKEVRAALSNVS